jgi:hypothetical protein
MKYLFLLFIPLFTIPAFAQSKKLYLNINNQFTTNKDSASIYLVIGKQVNEIPTLRELSQKTFEKEGELTELRVDLRRLESEIAAKIRETQMKAVPIEEAEEVVEETKEDTLDHSENLHPLRFQTMMPQDYPGEVLGR